MSTNLINITWAEDEDIAQFIDDFDEIEFCQEHGFYLIGRARDWIVMMNGDSLSPSIEINNDNETTVKTMNKEMINIIWADDEDIAQLSDDFVEIELREEYGLNLLGRARDAKQLFELIRRNEWQLDAVITDANMPYDRTEQKEDVRDRDLSGLNEVLSMKRDYKDVLFYIYSGRGKLLEDKYTSELNEFKAEGRIFYKNDLDSDVKMFNKIREDVEAHSTPEYQIHNRYQEEFEAAELIGVDAVKLLNELLLLEYNNEQLIPERHLFVDARTIMEAIFEACSKIQTKPGKGLLPKRLTLNQYVSLLVDGKASVCEMNEEGKKLLPFPLTKELLCFNEITQNSAHPLEVREYLNKLNESKTLSHIYLQHIALFILMDFLLWYQNIRDKYTNSGTELWIYRTKDEVIVRDKKGKVFSSHPYILEYKEGVKIGDKVGIIDCVLNKDSKTNNTFKYFVHADKYEVMSDEDGE